MAYRFVTTVSRPWYVGPSRSSLTLRELTVTLGFSWYAVIVPSVASVIPFLPGSTIATGVYSASH